MHLPWHLRSPRLSPFDDQIQSVVLLEQQGLICSASKSGVVAVWDMALGDVIATAECGGDVTNVPAEELKLGIGCLVPTLRSLLRTADCSLLWRPRSD